MTAVVTGASRGIGKEIAKQLVKSNWRVIGLARTMSDLLHLRLELGDNFTGCSIDITDYGALNRFAKQIKTRFETIDVLVNNASIFKTAPFVKTEPSDISSIVMTNLMGTMFCTQALLHFNLIKRPGGRIINISSVAALHGIINQAIYCASKSGLEGFSEALSQELRSEKILVSSIYPGGVDTSLWNESNPYEGNVKDLLKAEDIAKVVEYIVNLPMNVVMKKVIMFPEKEWH